MTPFQTLGKAVLVNGQQGLWIAKAFTCNCGKSPSIRKYLETIKNNGCNLPNTTVHNYQADQDSVIKHTETNNARIKERFEKEVNGKKIVKEYNHHIYAGKHVELNTEITTNGIKVHEEALIKPKEVQHNQLLKQKDEFEIGGNERFQNCYQISSFYENKPFVKYERIRPQLHTSLVDISSLNDVDECKQAIYINGGNIENCTTDDPEHFIPKVFFTKNMVTR